MAALGFTFLLYMTMSVTVGSELEPSSSPRVLDSITAPNQKDVENSTPITIQAENEQPLVYIKRKMVDISEALRKEFQALLSNHSLRVEQNLRNQSLLIVKLGKQLEDVQSILICTGEPPSPQNGRPVDFERKHGSEVRYRCDVNFYETENSTVRCHFGKWEGRPPLCIRPALSLRAHSAKNDWKVINVSCSTDVNGPQVHFSRVLDTGTGGALPTAARTYVRGRAAVLDLSGVPKDDKHGVYYCGRGNQTGITFVLQRHGGFNRPQVAIAGENATLSSLCSSDDAPFRWLRDGQPVPAWDGRCTVEIAGVRKEDAGVYEVYLDGERRATQWFSRLVVRGCPAGFFGERCVQKCPTCYNGGLCDEMLGTCVCLPGFEGQRCEVACGRNRVGPNCSEACDGRDCSFQVFCQPDPNGCSCAPGYWGYYCSTKCGMGKFGANCEQTCRCKDWSCNPYTGACSGGCSEGWSGPSCQIPAEN